jgi:hypothetical protein
VNRAPNNHDSNPPVLRNCTAEGKAAAADAVKSNFNFDLVGVSTVTAGGILMKGGTIRTVIDSTGEGLLYTGLWTAGSAATQAGATMFTCTISNVSTFLNWFGSLGGH